MNQLNEITDEEFVPFLHNLGVDTYKKSFEWMLNDPDFSEVLRWLYKNLDHNNALTPREEYRFSELDKRQKLLSETDLQSSIESIQHEYEGICLPGDQDKIVDVKLDINSQKERLQILEKQDKFMQDLITKNKTIQSELTLEISKLHAAQLQSVEDEKTESETCLSLAEEVETITEDVVDIVTNSLNLMGWTQSEKYWADKKCALKKICAQHAQSMRRTGGGPPDALPAFSPIEKKFVDVMGGLEFAIGDTHVAVNPFPGVSANPSYEEIAKMFYTFGPFDAYRQSQALFRSHFDLYTTKMFQKKRNDGLSDEELKNVLVEAKILEERLSDAVYAFIESKAELAGELSKLQLVSGYTQPHPSQIIGRTMETQSALGLARQEQRIAERQLRADAPRVPLARSAAVRRAAQLAAHAHMDAADAAAARLAALGAAALRADGGVRALLTTELRARAALTHFAAELRGELRDEACANSTRAESMNRIISEQALCEENLQPNDYLVSVLSKILSLSPEADVPAMVTAYDHLRAGVHDLKAAVEDRHRQKEDAIEAFVASLSPLRALVFSGRGRLPGGAGGAGGAEGLRRRAREAAAAADARVLAAGAAFTAAKNGDKQSLRKLWQWFVAEPRRLPPCPGLGAHATPHS